MTSPMRNAGLGALAVILVSAMLAGCGAYTTSASKNALLANSSEVSFGEVVFGKTAVQTVTVSNTGDTTLNISRADVTGRGFQLVGGNLSGALAAGASLSLKLQFSPASLGATTGTVTLVSDGPDPALRISLRGTGAQLGLNVSPGSLNFSNVPVGQSSTQNISLTNSGTSNVALNPATITGPGFTVSGLPAPVKLAAGQTILVAVKFSPTGLGPVTGAVSLGSNAANSPEVISLSGVGLQAMVSSSATSVSFGKVVVGNTNSQPITLRNSGNATLTFSQLDRKSVV